MISFQWFHSDRTFCQVVTRPFLILPSILSYGFHKSVSCLLTVLIFQYSYTYIMQFQPSLAKIQELISSDAGNCVPIYSSIPADILTPIAAYLRLTEGCRKGNACLSDTSREESDYITRLNLWSTLFIYFNSFFLNLVLFNVRIFIYRQPR